MIKISVILPVFDAGTYIEHCIKSILLQTEKNIELIIINDGSTDNSLFIIDQFANIDKRVKVFNQVNTGVSSARNRGLEMSCGEWIAFADADDWMEPDMLENLYNLAISTKAGMVVCNVNQIQKDKSSNLRINLKEGLFNFKGEPEKAVEAMMNFKYDYANWNKLYNGNIIRKHKIRFDENISIGEDLLFNLYYLNSIENIICINIPLYNYRLHEDSAMAKSSDKRIAQYDYSLRNTNLLLKRMECLKNGMYFEE